MIPVLIPSLPETDAIVPYLRRIDEAHIYSNYGPLTNEFTVRLCRFISDRGGGPVHAALTSSGTTAIELALRYRSAGRPGRTCILPSWTFIATAHAVANVGLTPYFADIDPETLALTPEIAARALRGNPGDVAAVIVVSPCGAPIDIAAWEAFEAEHGVPVVFDAAAATLNLEHVGAQPLCVSLHATKAFGIGEGGAIITSDAAMVEALTAMTGFGFSAGSRVSQMRGGNYRISEYAAAVGLAVLDELDPRIARLRAASLAYVAGFERFGVSMQAGFGHEWLTMTANAIFEPSVVSAVTAGFDAAGIQWRRWYGDGCHAHPTFAACAHDDLAATRGVAETAIGVPFFPTITPDQIAQVCGCAERVMSAR
ncbi:aminotransferase class I/II-fold pyridoxal phosphate-dependent enzyme [Methylobacterium sp. WL18]|uniref:DegT/DnrJ/EryC1/StrS family aminotransferase n=1 Tax=Methylobacterium sp. WL18 TaxID=2603897 RepID=UPI0011CC0268|nr:aminotransferase class I/II-fold pyridoxal phosphate-dependent enzyme [Methylobacterium sp. WL18]TXN75947.1 aminotransferase class I/II-fold pyridoxal phosphate-dependent enzyme [Methylobacterium sp. WL18]